MTPVNTAIWYIESHLLAPLSLTDISNAAKVSPNHLSRAFVAVTGTSVMGYVRARRMTEATNALLANNTDILTIAICFGYNSHEAFSRAFKDVFGVSPREYARSADHLNHNRKEAALMDETLLEELDVPRFEQRERSIVAGHEQRYKSDESAAGIPLQWQEFVPHLGNIPGQIGDETFGVCWLNDEGLSYLCGVMTDPHAELLDDFSRITLEPQTYVVFEHQGHVSDIRRTWSTVFQMWFPQSGMVRTEAPDFEWYSPDFDPESGTGRIEIWIPIEK